MPIAQSYGFPRAYFQLLIWMSASTVLPADVRLAAVYSYLVLIGARLKELSRSWLFYYHVLSRAVDLIAVFSVQRIYI